MTSQRLHGGAAGLLGRQGEGKESWKADRQPHPRLQPRRGRRFGRVTDLSVRAPHPWSHERGGMAQADEQECRIVLLACKVRESSSCHFHLQQGAKRQADGRAKVLKEGVGRLEYERER